MGKRHTLHFWLREFDESRREDFGHSTDARGHDKEASRRSLEDPDPERLCQRGVEEDLRPRK